jgi:hypothetical protein
MLQPACVQWGLPITTPCIGTAALLLLRCLGGCTTVMRSPLRLCGPAWWTVSSGCMRKHCAPTISILLSHITACCTVTAATSSGIADGASALLLCNEAGLNGATPLARILAFSSYAHEPEWFTTAPVGAIRALLKQLNWTVDQVCVRACVGFYVSALCASSHGYTKQKLSYSFRACSVHLRCDCMVTHWSLLCAPCTAPRCADARIVCGHVWGILRLMGEANSVLWERTRCDSLRSYSSCYPITTFFSPSMSLYGVLFARWICSK